MLNLSCLGTEAIDFQVGSPFSKELIVFFDGLMEKRDALRLQGKDPRASLRGDLRTFTDNFSKIIEKHTGIKVSSLTVVGDKEPSGGIIFAAGIDFNEFHIWDVAKKYSGDQDVRNTAENIKQDQKDFSKLSDTLNPNTGKVNASLGKMDGVRIRIWFDMSCGMFAKEDLNPSVEELTASELAAIMIHEIGHIISTIEYGSDLIRRHDRVVEVVRANSGPIPKEEKIKQVKALREQLSKANLTDEQRKVAENIEKVMTENDSIIGRFLAMILQSWCAVVSIYIWMWVGAIFAGFRSIFGVDENYVQDYSQKTSDFAASNHGKSLCERYADEYATRHMVAAPLTSALTKINKIRDFTMVHSRFLIGSLGQRYSMMYNSTVLRGRILRVLMTYDPSAGGIYEPEVRRVYRLLQNMQKVFKDSAMDPSMKAYMIKDFEDLEEAVNKSMKDRSFLDSVANFNLVIQSFFNIPNFINLIARGRFDKNYEELMNALESVGNNKLFFRASKLEDLANK